MRRLLVILTAVALLGSCASHMDQEPPHHVSPTTSRADRAHVLEGKQLKHKPVEPGKLCASSLGCALVIPVELTGNELTPPADPQVLGWWGSKVNAKKGTTLLIGHTVHTGGGFLNDLDQKALVGSSVRVSGHVYHVVSNRVISKLKLSQIAPELFSQAGPNKLVVVTCEGYDPATGHYHNNTVVVAK